MRSLATTNNPNHFRRSGALVLGLVLLTLGAGTSLAADARGLLHGKVTTSGGSEFEGRIRWGNEESGWGDFFNSSKKHREFPDDMPESEKRKEKIRIFGMTIGVRWKDVQSSRVFKARFGDIDRIEILRGERAVVVMKSGTEFEVEGGSNDLGGKIQIWDPGIGEVELDWDRIQTIDFRAAPRSLKVEVERLHGTVQTSAGEFRGFIQWDQDETLSTDKLDGETREAKLALEMGRLKSIERRSRSSSRVTLRDGREFVLEGSNDIDSGNRGIYVEDERYGRVLVPWEAFDRVDFSDPGNSGPAYDDFKPGRRLNGKVTDVEGNEYRGLIVYDLDETESWELFDGKWRDIQYSIPFSMIAAVIPETGDSSRVELTNGAKLELEDTADTGDGNAGIMVFEDGREIYLSWDDVARVDFDH